MARTTPAHKSLVPSEGSPHQAGTQPPVGTIAVGDCIELMASWTPACLDLVFADPPYNIGYAYDRYEDRRSDEDYLDWTCRWIDGCVRLLKPTGSLYILIGDEYAAEVRVHLKRLERERKLVFRNWIVWHYTFGQNCRTKLNRSHAHLFYAVGPALFDAKAGRGGDTDGAGGASSPFTFHRERVAVPSARQTTYGDVRANPAGKLPDDTWYLRPQEALADRDAAPQGPHLFDADGDTWYLARLCGTFKERQGWHPCQLPEALLERIIKLSSSEGDTVFDPFSGSGTTLAVAARLGRRWLGCEMSHDYAKKAMGRVLHSQSTGQTQLTDLEARGVDYANPKKKPEPRRSAHLRSGASRGV